MGIDRFDRHGLNHRLDDYGLFNLLNLNHYIEEERSKLDGDAIMKEVQRNPRSAEVICDFQSGACFPLQQAILLRAPSKVINVLCSPEVFKLEAFDDEYIPLHLAVSYGASLDVIKLLLEKQPEAARAFDYSGNTPLHLACAYRAPLEVISLLLKTWPDSLYLHNHPQSYTPLHFACHVRAPMEVIALLVDSWSDPAQSKFEVRETPLHVACCFGAPLDVISLLLERWPEAAKTKESFGNTPLHLAVFHRRVSLESTLLLLDAYPQAAQEKNYFAKTPSDEFIGYAQVVGFKPKNEDELADIQKVLFDVSTLLQDKTQNINPNEIIRFFADIQWRKGLLLVFDRYPTAAKVLDLDTVVMADFFSLVGRRCKLTSMWEAIRNEQELLADI